MVVGIAVGGYYGFQQYQAKKQLDELSKPVYSTNSPTPQSDNSKSDNSKNTLPAPSLTQPTTTNNFKCDGRQYCTQMTSLAEAKYFIAHCPDTKMDGNHDGEPCESDSRFH